MFGAMSCPARPIALTANQARTHLLEMSHLPPGAPAQYLEDLAADLVGLHATGMTSPYVQAFARMTAIAKDDLDRALYVRRSLVRVRCMRGTVFILPRDLAAVAVAATRAQVQPASGRFLLSLGTSEPEYERLAARIEQVLAVDDETLTAAQLRERLGEGTGLSGVVNLMCDQGRLYRDRPTGTWRSRTVRYSLPGDLAPVLRPAMEARPARLALVLRYIERYGPVTVGDIAWWSGIPLREIRAYVAQLKPGLETISVAGSTEPALMAVVQLEAAVGSGGTEPGHTMSAVAFLPELDPYLMGRRDRTLMIPEASRAFVFDRSGNATSVILVDGIVRGIWSAVHAVAPRVLIHFLDDVGAEARAEACRQATTTGRFWFGSDVDVCEVGTMRPLAAGDSGTFLAPLGRD